MSLRELLKIILVIIVVLVGANLLIRGCAHMAINGLVLTRRAVYERETKKPSSKETKPDAAAEQDKSKSTGDNASSGAKTVPANH